MGILFCICPDNPVFEIQNDTGKGIINVTLAYLIGHTYDGKLVMATNAEFAPYEFKEEGKIVGSTST